MALLDVGTGNGATMRELGAWAGAHGARWHTTGVELSAAAATIAGAAGREGGRAKARPTRGDGGPDATDEGPMAEIVRADALRLPFGDDAFDAVTCTLTLHHFDDRAAAAVLREMARVSRGLVVVSDLERASANYLGARLLALTLWRTDRITRNDGPLSVLRSFTIPELERLGREAGLSDVRVRRHAPWRLVLEGRA